MNLIGPINSGVAAGGAGVATANANSASIVSGFIYAVYVRYNDSPPAGTTDVTISTKGDGAPAVTILTLTNVATDRWVYPRVLHQDTAGADVAGSYDWIAVHDRINVKIDQANAGDSVDVWIVTDTY